MSTKKKANKADAKKTEKTIQYVGIAMIVIVVAIIAWPYVAKLLPRNQSADAVPPTSVAAPATTSAASAGSAADVGSETACAAFDSIPAADQYNEAPPMNDRSNEAVFCDVQDGEWRRVCSGVVSRQGADHCE